MSRRRFVRNLPLVMAGIGLTTQELIGANTTLRNKAPREIPKNPLVLFDNFHVGNRRSYSWEAKLAAAAHAGFDGFEIVMQDPQGSDWSHLMKLARQAPFSTWGFHWTTKAVIDKNAHRIQEEISKIEANVQACSECGLNPYFTLSLSGTDELKGNTIKESGSAKAESRHWDRAFQIIHAFDRSCQKYQVNGSLYPHIHWICDTPQSMFKILDGADARHIGPAFCSHHWYGNPASWELDPVLANPWMKKLNYCVLTNGRFYADGFQAVRFDEGEIDMAWVLAKIYAHGYEGPISTQGWKIGGDPLVAGQRFVNTMRTLRKRFVDHPELNPLYTGS